MYNKYLNVVDTLYSICSNYYRYVLFFALLNSVISLYMLLFIS